jgi:hypothetical protein
MFGSKVYAVGIVLVVFATAGTLAYFYYQNAEAKILRLTKNNITLNVAVEAKTSVIVSLESDITKNNILANELTVSLAASNDYKTDLLERLQQHDLTRLSLLKPRLIETRINDATKKIFDDIERDTAP